MTEGAGKLAVERSNRSLRVVTVEIRHSLRPIYRFIRHAPTFQKQIVLMIVQEKVSQLSIRRKGLQPQQV
jgi:hypothetical protein